MDQSKEIPLLESLQNFQEDACNICHIPSKCYHFTLQNGKQWQSDYTLNVLWQLMHSISNGHKHVHRMVNCIEQLTIN